MRKIFICLALALMAGCSSNETDPLLQELDEVLQQKDTYLNYFTDRVEILKDVLAEQDDPEQTYNINKRLADAYKAYSLDTTVLYLEKNRVLAKNMASVSKLMEVDFMMIDEYCMAGYYVEAGDILSQYKPESIPAEMEVAYLRACHKYYGETMAYASSEEAHDDKRLMRDAYRTRLLELIPENTYEWYDLKREEASTNENVELERKYAKAMVDACPVNSHDYAKACYMYHTTFSDDDVEKRMEWLIRSSIADAMCAIRDYMSLISLSELLFECGDVERAFKYAADHCMTDALHFNGRLRQWQLSQFFPQIERAYNERNMYHMRMMFIFVLVISLFLVALIFLLFYIYKRQQILVSTRDKLKASYLEIDDRNHELVAINSKLTSLNAQMLEADKVKQEYIALFLSILSENISKTRQYKNHVLKNIRQGNAKKLADEIEALPPIDEDIYEFYRMFDQTFVNLYPDFVQKFNELLVDGAAIVPKGDDILTPELRIFALIKLGITDSSKIASLLHYSANTIYNYRAKTKNKARGSRDEFEAAVRSIE